MPTRTEFQILAQQRLNDAQVLFETGTNYDGSFYLAGYAVECALKAAICARMDVDIFNLKEDIKSFKTHNIKLLLLFSGLSKILPADQTAQGAYSHIFEASQGKEWTEQRRYNPTGCSKGECEDFLEAVKSIVSWIRAYW